MLGLHHNTLRPWGQNGWQFADHVLCCILLKRKFDILIWISQKFVKDLIDNKSILVQVVAWYLEGA